MHDAHDPVPGSVERIPADPDRRSLRIGIGGPVGTGKTALVERLCRALAERVPTVVVTNDLFTTSDADALKARHVLEPERIVAVRTGGCPHTAVREDVSVNLDAVESLEDRYDPELVLVESGGDNLTLTWSRALVDRQIFVLDCAGGDDVPGKGGPGIGSSDLLVINKTDLAPHVGADVDRMLASAHAARDGRPVVATCVRGGDEAAEVVATVERWLSDRATQ